jgi:hypothetical protein
MQIFSPNMLKTFEECPQKFIYMYVDKINYKQAQQLLYDFVGKMFLPEDYR